MTGRPLPADGQSRRAYSGKGGEEKGMSESTMAE